MVRHIRCAWEFLHKGFWIYSHPVSEYAPIGDQRAYIWTGVGYLYPPGALLFFIPFALLYYGFKASLTLVGKLMVCSMVTLWHIACGIPLVRGRNLSSLYFFYLLFAYFYGIGWSLNGQYEALPVMFLMLAACSDAANRQQTFLSLAIFTKFQSLLYLPVFLRSGLQEARRLGYQEYFKRSMKCWWFWLLILSAFCLALSRGFLAPDHANAIGWGAVIDGESKALFCISITLIFFGLLLLRRSFFWAATILFQQMMLSSVAQLQLWYMCFLLPLPFFAEEEKLRDILMMYIIIFLWAFGLPDPYFFISLIVSSHFN